jgi:plasmid replication initiation protein
MINEQHLVVQSNPLVEAQYKLSEAEQKLLRVIISMIQPNTSSLQKQFYRFVVQDFAKFLGRLQSHHAIHQQMRRMAHNLKTSRVKVVLPNGDTIETSWIAAFKYPRNKGWIEFEISWMLEEQLLLVKEQFTQYYLVNISKLKGEYSVRIYELVQQYANSNMRSRTINIDQLKISLGVKYPTGTFFQRVIKPSHKEICAKTDITFSYRPIKESRKIVAVEFYDIQKKSIITSSILSLIPKKHRKNKDVIKNLSKYLELHGPEYVTEKLQYVESRKDVADYPKYLYSALQNNHGEGFKSTQESLPEITEFASGTVFEFAGKRYTYDGNGLRITDAKILGPEELSQAIKIGLLTTVSKEKLQKERMEALTVEFEKYRQQKVNDYIARLSLPEKDALEQTFVGQELNDITRGIYKQSGMGSLIINALFVEFVARQHLPEVNFSDFARENSEDNT